MLKETLRLRIAMVAACPFPYPRGTPIRILRMAETLAELGQDVHVITYHLGETAQSLSFPVHRTPNLPFYRKLSPGPSYVKLMVIDPLLAFSLIKLHRRYRFDIIHAHHVEGLMASLPIRFFENTPIVFDAHTLLQTELHHYRFFPLKRLEKGAANILDKQFPRLADYVICVSDPIRAHFANCAGIALDRIALLPNGIELSHFESIPVSRDFPPGEEIILGFSGNFAKYQGIDCMLKAVSMLIDPYPALKLHIFSNDSIHGFQELINRLKLAQRIEVFPTSFQELPAQLASVDLLLNPRPDGAGTPMKIINYMVVGKPVVSFEGSAHIIQHGRTGWLVPGGSALNFADGIRHLLTHRELARKLGESASAYVRQQFSWRSRGEELIRIYEQLVYARSHRRSFAEGRGMLTKRC